MLKNVQHLHPASSEMNNQPEASMLSQSSVRVSWLVRQRQSVFTANAVCDKISHGRMFLVTQNMKNQTERHPKLVEEGNTQHEGNIWQEKKETASVPRWFIRSTDSKKRAKHVACKAARSRSADSLPLDNVPIQPTQFLRSKYIEKLHRKKDREYQESSTSAIYTSTPLKRSAWFGFHAKNHRFVER